MSSVVLIAPRSCPMWVSIGSYAHRLLHGSAYGKFVKKIRERREGEGVKVLNTQIPALYSCHLAGCVLDNDSSSLDGLCNHLESCNHPSDPERADALLPQKYHYSCDFPVPLSRCLLFNTFQLVLT